MRIFNALLLMAACGSSESINTTDANMIQDSGTRADAQYICTGKQSVVEFQNSCYPEGTKTNDLITTVTGIVANSSITYVWLKDAYTPISEYNGIVAVVDPSNYYDCSTGPCSSSTPDKVHPGDCISVRNGQWAKATKLNAFHDFEAYDNTFKFTKLSSAACIPSYDPIETTLPQLFKYTQAFDGVLFTVKDLQVTVSGMGDYLVTTIGHSSDHGYIMFTGDLFFGPNHPMATASECLNATGFGYDMFKMNRGYEIEPRTQEDLQPIQCP